MSLGALIVLLGMMMASEPAWSQAIVIVPSTLPPGTQGLAYNQTVVANDSDADDVSGPTDADDIFTYSVVAGALPTGLTLNVFSGNISGTPSAGGSFSFTLRATDGNGATGDQAYTVQIGTNALTVNPPTLPNGTQGASYNQTISASGGTGPYTYSVSAGALPAGLTLNASTGSISGIPSASGPASFTIQALDTVGNIGTRDYAINIGTNSLTVNPPSLPPGTQGVAYNQTVTASGGTGPYTYAVASGSLPAGLSLDPNTGSITGTPTGSGQSIFTIQATDSTGNTGSRSYAVNIGTNSLTINPATLPPAPQGTPYSQTVVASGGATPYIYTVIAGALPPGLSLNASSGAITGTPTTIGTYNFTIQARDINGNIGSRGYTLGTARLNPALDPDVRGLIGAEVSATRRFADTQITNVMRHLEGLHDDFDPCGVNFDISVRDALRGGTYPDDPYRAAGFPDAGQPAAQIARRTPNGPECRRNAWWNPTFAVWASGSVELGSNKVTGPANDNRFSTSGLTSGIDSRVTDNLIVGGAIGYARDTTDIGAASTRSDGSGVSGMVYASYRPFALWFVDALAGYSYLSFDTRRSVAIDSSTVTGLRTGSSWFASVSLSAEFKQEGWTVAPYVRADVLTAALKGYSEQGLSNQALTFGAISFSTASGVLGVRGAYDFPMHWGVLTPNARLEYKHSLDGGFSQSMFYTDLGQSFLYAIDQKAVGTELFSATAGLRARTKEGLAFDLEYGASTAAAAATRSQTVRASARFAF